MLKISLALLPFMSSLAFSQIKRTETFFSIPLQAGATLEKADLETLFPLEILRIKGTMRTRDISNIIPSAKIRSSHGFAKGNLPLTSYFEHIEISQESGKMRDLNLVAHRLPPSKGRFIAWIRGLEHLLGPPKEAYREFRYDRVNEQSLTLVWSTEQDVILLRAKRDASTLDLYLTYLPGSDNPALPRLANIPREPVKFESSEKLVADFTEKLQFFPEGDEVIQVMEVPDNERDLLAAYSAYILANDLSTDHDRELIWKPFRAKLEIALDEFYGEIPKRERFRRLSKITEGKISGFTTGDVQVGAAMILAKYDDPDAIEYLFRGLEVELPTGVETACAAGIARQCEGDIMDRVLQMLEFPNSRDDAGSILSGLSTKRQFTELAGKRKSIQRPQRDIVDRNLTRLIRAGVAD